MAAARELGELRDPRALEALGRVTLSDNLLLASSVISALGAYEDNAALPYLLRAAGQSSVSSVSAMELAARSHDVLEPGRQARCRVFSCRSWFMPRPVQLRRRPSASRRPAAAA